MLISKFMTSQPAKQTIARHIYQKVNAFNQWDFSVSRI